eukprot:s94_g44.t1
MPATSSYLARREETSRGHHSWKVQVSNPFLRQCCAQIHAGETTQDSMTWSECIKKSCPEINAANHVTI